MARYIVEKKEIYTNRVPVEAESIEEALTSVEYEEGEVEFERTLPKDQWNVILNGEYVY